VCAGLLVAGCGDGDDGEDGGVQQRDRLSSPDTAALVEQALAARAKNDSAEFASLVATAAEACPDGGTAGRLGEVAVIAARWSSALQDGRPKVQAVTEDQLAGVDWDALVQGCDGS